jgi:hypothetical protein
MAPILMHLAICDIPAVAVSYVLLRHMRLDMDAIVQEAAHQYLLNPER